MKRILAILGVFFFFTLSSLGAGLKLGVSLGYYSVSDLIYEKAYGSGNLMYGGFISYDLINIFEVRGEINYFKDRGLMTLTEEEIEFSIMPIVLGARAKLKEIRNLAPYLGAGIDFYSFKEKSRLGDTSDSTTGFHLEGGTYIALGRRFHVDLNLRYVKADAKPYDETIKLGGLRVGIGVGISF